MTCCVGASLAGEIQIEINAASVAEPMPPKTGSNFNTAGNNGGLGLRPHQV